MNRVANSMRNSSGRLFPAMSWLVAPLLGWLMCWAQVSAADSSQPKTYASSRLDAGVFVLAEHRFDPSLQRLLAQQSLDALPLYNGRLFYIVPSRLNTGEQQVQIRYLEQLLDKARRAEAVTSEGKESTPATD